MNLSDEKWIYRHIKMAREIATWSKDPSTKVGAIIITERGGPVSWGYNGIPMGVNDEVDERYERPTKYHYFAHAERNALDLSRSSVEGCWMFVTHPPCSDCARGIIQTGIKKVVVDNNGVLEFKKRDLWSESNRHTIQMFKESGVILSYYLTEYGFEKIIKEDSCS